MRFSSWLFFVLTCFAAAVPAVILTPRAKTDIKTTPTNSSTVILEQRDDFPECDDPNSGFVRIGDRPTAWFQTNQRPEWQNRRISDNALFYTAGLSTIARKYADQNGKITIWHIWPCENYYIKMTRTNPLKCIFRSLTDQNTYFENMSRAFAIMAAGPNAYVMHRDIVNYPQNTIWGNVEKPTLQQSTDSLRVNEIRQIQYPSGTTGVEWDRNQANPPADSTLQSADGDTASVFSKRDEFCFPDSEWEEMYGPIEGIW